jgi:hypothetical protein
MIDTSSQEWAFTQQWLQRNAVARFGPLEGIQLVEVQAAARQVLDTFNLRDALTLFAAVGRLVDEGEVTDPAELLIAVQDTIRSRELLVDFLESWLSDMAAAFLAGDLLMDAVFERLVKQFGQDLHDMSPIAQAARELLVGVGEIEVPDLLEASGYDKAH